MSNSLDRICTVDISLASPISNDANFDNILILGPAPANPTGDVPAIGVYNSLEELTALGIAATGERTDPVGVAARVAFSQSPRPHEVYVAFMGDIVDKETEDPALQTVSAVLENALAVNGWYCICPVGLADEKVKEIIQWTETQNKLCGYIDKDPDKPIVDAGLYLRSFPFFPKETADQLENDIPAENLYGMAVAAAVKAMNYHAGQETWALMPLATVSPAKLTSTFIKKLEAANFNYVITVASKNITQGGKTGGGECFAGFELLQIIHQRPPYSLMVASPVSSSHSRLLVSLPRVTGAFFTHHAASVLNTRPPFRSLIRIGNRPLPVSRSRSTMPEKYELLSLVCNRVSLTL